MNYSFAVCKNLVINANDKPDLSNVTDMYAMFGCLSFFMNVQRLISIKIYPTGMYQKLSIWIIC